MSKTDTDGKRRTRSTSIGRCAGVELHAREPGAGEAVERPRREHQEEVRPEGVPFDFAEAQDSRFHGLARDVEGEAVAELEPELLLVFRRDRHYGSPRSASSHQRPATIRLSTCGCVGPGQVLLALGETLAAVVGGLDLLDRPRR